MTIQQALIVGIFIGAAIALGYNLSRPRGRVTEKDTSLADKGERVPAPSRNRREEYAQSPVRDPYRTPGRPPRTGSAIPPRPNPSPKPQRMMIVPVEHPMILDKATYVPVVTYLKAWAEREQQRAEDRRAKAVRKGDQRDQRMAIGARDALGDVLRELNRVEYR